jgi:hypothetical protein
MRRKAAVYERKHQKVAPLTVFARRLGHALVLIGVLVVFALAIGISGYHWIAGFGWVDSLLNASMILGGMGPVNPLQSTGAKLFASAYALFSGIAFIAAMGIALSPVIHRVLHKFHADESDLEAEADPRKDHHQDTKTRRTTKNSKEN